MVHKSDKVNLNNKEISLVFNLSQHSQWLLIATFIANVLTIISELAWWLIALLALCLLWRVGLNRLSLNRPSSKSSFSKKPKRKKSAQKWLLVIFALSGCVILAITGKALGLLLAMVHLLCFSYGLKMLEMHSRKDFYQLFFIGLFILAASFIFRQSLAYFSVFTAVLVLNMALLLSHFSAKASLKSHYGLSFKLLLQSVPLAVALFLLFPKLSPLWQVPLAKSAQTGLSDQVSVGDVANLALSDSVAFRVTFETATPAYQQLYWRTLVLDIFDGKAWRQQPLKGFGKKPNRNYADNRQELVNSSIEHPVTGAETRYQIIVEPSFQHWLFALDVAKAKQSEIISLADFSLYSLKLLSQSMSYQVSSYLQSPLNLELSERQKVLNLQLPENTNPKLWREGQRLRKRYINDENLIQAVLKRFREQEYYYTLQPPLLGNQRGEQALDQFYFQSKAGFCEHYASSFAFLMRAAGIPTRLVVGYLGGEYNPQGQFYTIKQRDAHAWTEVWLQNKGWQRVDPTAAVSPDRVERGFSDDLLAQRSSLSGELVNLYQLKSIKWLNALRLQLDSLDYQWTKWVVGYSATRQLNLLSRWFGQVKLWKNTLTIAAVLIITMLALVILNNYKKAVTSHCAWVAYYLKLLKDIEKKGLIKEKNNSALQFSTLVGQQWPALAIPFARFSHTFTVLQYQQLNAAEQQAYLTVIKQQYKQCKLVLKQQKALVTES